MKRLIITIIILGSLIFSITFYTAAENYTMSWRFRIFNNPNARQVAINTAEKQDGLIEENQDPVQRFRESFERRLMSTVQRNLINQILDEDTDAGGNFQTGDLDITVTEDPDTGEVTLEITDINTGETTIISYSADEWPTDYNY